jgi:hypothetical protein
VTAEVPEADGNEPQLMLIEERKEYRPEKSFRVGRSFVDLNQ